MGKVTLSFKERMKMNNLKRRIDLAVAYQAERLSRSEMNAQRATLFAREQMILSMRD